MAAIAKTTNPWITALVGCAVLAAIISTATSLINAISSNLIQRFQIIHFTASRYHAYGARDHLCAFRLQRIFSAFYFDNIVDLLIQSYELSVSCLFIPIFIALFKNKDIFLLHCSSSSLEPSDFSYLAYIQSSFRKNLQVLFCPYSDMDVEMPLPIAKQEYRINQPDLRRRSYEK